MSIGKELLKIRVTPEVKAEVEELARKHNLTLTGATNLLVHEAINERRRLRQLARREDATV